MMSRRLPLAAEAGDGPGLAHVLAAQPRPDEQEYDSDNDGRSSPMIEIRRAIRRLLGFDAGSVVMINPL